MAPSDKHESFNGLPFAAFSDSIRLKQTNDPKHPIGRVLEYPLVWQRAGRILVNLDISAVRASIYNIVHLLLLELSAQLVDKSEADAQLVPLRDRRISHC